MHVNIKVNCYLRVKKMTACIERTLRKLAEKYFCIFVNLMCLFVIFRTKQNNFNTSYLHEQHETSGHILEFFFTHTHTCARACVRTLKHMCPHNNLYIYIYICICLYMDIYIYMFNNIQSVCLHAAVFIINIQAQFIFVQLGEGYFMFLLYGPNQLLFLANQNSYTDSGWGAAYLNSSEYNFTVNIY